MPGYPRWASSDTSGELLLGKSKWRPMPHSIGPGGSMPPYGGIPFGDLPAGLGHDLGLPKHLLAWALAMYRLAHSHP